MDKYNRAFKAAITRISRAATATMQDLANSRFPDEPSTTASLMTRFRDALSGHTSGGIRWDAKVLSSHGPNTEEGMYGADFLGVLHLAFPEIQVSKGFLAQAKRQEPGSKLRSSEWERLQKQCEDMLVVTPESFVFVYALNGVFIVPAISVLASQERTDLHTLAPRATGPFFKDHFRCFVGDRRLDSADSDAFGDFSYRTGLEVQAHGTAK